MATLRGLNADEVALMTHICMFGSTGYPIRKVGSKHWAWEYRGLHSVRVYPTKREAVESFEAYHRILRDAKAGRI